MSTAPNKASVEQLRNELGARFQRPLMTFFLRRIKDRSLAEDFTQDVLLKVVRASERGQIERADSYVFKVAINLLRDHRRRALRTGPAIFLPIEEDRDGQLESQLVEAISRAGAYDRAVMERVPNATCFAQQTVAQGCVGGQQDLSGKPLFNAPKWNISANSQYDVPVTHHNWKPFVTGSVRWQSQVVFNLLQDPDSVQKAYSLFDLAVGAQDEHWRLTVFCNNVFDKSYALTRGRNGVFNISQTANPPTDAIGWTPARDSVRYFGIRIGGNF